MRKTLSALGLLLAAVLPMSCAQNNPDAPDIGGYSQALVIVKVTAIPDVLPADGVSTAQLRLEAKDRDLNPLPGRTVAFYIVDVISGPIIGVNVPTRFCSALSSIGVVTISRGITDANGITWGEFRSGTGTVYAEDISSNYDPNKPPPDPCTDPRYAKFQPTQFWTVIRGKLTDPRESESEWEIQDDVSIEQAPY